MTDLEQLRAKNARIAEALVDAMIVPEAWMISGRPIGISDEAWAQIQRSVHFARAALSADPAPVVNGPDWEGFGRALMDNWPTGDVEGSDLFDLSRKYRLIVEVPGGYDPEEHIDAEGICPEKGDTWFEYNFRGERQ